jgi:hypothetical protein
MKSGARGNGELIRIRVADSDVPGTATPGNGVVLLGVYHAEGETRYPALLGYFQSALEDMYAKCPRGAAFRIVRGEGCHGLALQWFDFELCILTFAKTHADVDIQIVNK